MSKVKYVGRLLEPIKSIKKHSHEFFEVVCYTSGTGFVDIEGETVPFSQGDVFIIPPSVAHFDYSVGGFQNYHFEFEDESFPLDRWVEFRDNENDDFLAIIKIMYREYQLKRPNYKDIVESLYTVLFHYMMTFCDGVRYSKPVEFAVGEIVDNFSNPKYDFSETMKKLPMNHDYFRRLFVRETGKTPLRYLTDMRIGYAKRLLHLRSKSGLSVQDIAWMSGFSDSLYFSRVFKKEVGVAPKYWT